MRAAQHAGPAQLRHPSGLPGAVAGLETSVSGYAGALDQAAAAVDGTARIARTLDATADGLLRAAGG